MTDLRCPISRAELDDALSIGASGVFCAALIDNPHLIEDDLGVDSERLSAEQHALVSMMSLEANFLQDGVDCLLWRLGPSRRVLPSIGSFGWSDLDSRLTKFFALMEPYTIDEAWWARLRSLDDAGAFDDFDAWFREQELEMGRRVVEFARLHEAALFVVRA